MMQNFPSTSLNPTPDILRHDSTRPDHRLANDSAHHHLRHFPGDNLDALHGRDAGNQRLVAGSAEPLVQRGGAGSGDYAVVGVSG